MVADDSGTLHVAEHTVRCWAGRHVEFLYGYRESQHMGSYVPAALGGRNKLVEVYDQTSDGCKLITGSTVSISGFPVNPGRRWLTSIACNGVGLTQVAAERFYFSYNTATWEWTQQFDLQRMVGNAVRCTISHS